MMVMLELETVAVEVYVAGDDRDGTSECIRRNTETLQFLDFSSREGAAGIEDVHDVVGIEGVHDDITSCNLAFSLRSQFACFSVGAAPLARSEAMSETNLRSLSESRSHRARQ